MPTQVDWHASDLHIYFTSCPHAQPLEHLPALHLNDKLSKRNRYQSPPAKEILAEGVRGGAEQGSRETPPGRDGLRDGEMDTACSVSPGAGCACPLYNHVHSGHLPRGSIQSLVLEKHHELEARTPRQNRHRNPSEQIRELEEAQALPRFVAMQAQDRSLHRERVTVGMRPGAGPPAPCGFQGFEAAEKDPGAAHWFPTLPLQTTSGAMQPFGHHSSQRANR